VPVIRWEVLAKRCACETAVEVKSAAVASIAAIDMVVASLKWMLAEAFASSPMVG
jgi:hypothetical protein